MKADSPAAALDASPTVPLAAEEVARRLADPARRARVAPEALPGGILPGEVLPGEVLPGADAGAAVPVAAAVLVAVVLHPAPTVLLTLRTARLTAHAGQVAFPGGRIEPGESPEQAALREAWEEIGLDPALPRVLGRLPGLVTGTGYHITPILALLPPPLRLAAEPGEVAAIFEYDLHRLLDPRLPQRQKARFRGEERAFWVWPHDQHHVWGATAAILRDLALVLR